MKQRISMEVVMSMKDHQTEPKTPEETSAQPDDADSHRCDEDSCQLWASPEDETEDDCCCCCC